MRKLLVIAMLALFSSAVMAQSCEEKAVSKDGKPLVGAAKSAFVKKCEKDTKPSCESQAVSKDGKPLAGAAKASFMKKCEAGK